MEITITKGPAEDRIAIDHGKGRRMETSFPKKGFIPHDAVHLFVEAELGLKQGFWGMVAAGRHPEEIAGIAKAAGHASASRNRVPDASIVELLQAERLVECFEADQWSESSGAAEDLIAMAEVACAASHVALPAIDAEQVQAIRTAISTFAKDWMAAPLGYAVSFNWEQANG
ncbi:MAG: hypothetical protein RLZZ415_1826 [Pseudomonadota bacterium]|jgi:hypothetical protein